MPTRHVYMEELDLLYHEVVKMGSLTEDSINDMIEALSHMDTDLAGEIMRNDEVIDNLERDIEKSCISLILKQQPVATDLRNICSIMRIIADIERIADHCSDISEYILMMSQKEHVAKPKYIDEMIEEMKSMVRMTIDSFVKKDIAKAEEVIRRDDRVDSYFEEIMEELCIAMKHNPEKIDQFARYLMIVKYVERMADHATNIAGWVSYIVTGDLDDIE